MINIGLYYRVKSGHEREFEQSFGNALSALRNGHPGFLGGRLYKEVGDSREYMLYTEWDGIDSFKKFLESKEYASTVEFGKTIIEGVPRHKFFESKNS